jgi:hypothetical protein
MKRRALYELHRITELQPRRPYSSVYEILNYVELYRKESRAYSRLYKANKFLETTGKHLPSADVSF